MLLLPYQILFPAFKNFVLICSYSYFYRDKWTQYSSCLRWLCMNVLVFLVLAFFETRFLTAENLQVVMQCCRSCDGNSICGCKCNLSCIKLVLWKLLSYLRKCRYYLQLCLISPVSVPLLYCQYEDFRWCILILTHRPWSILNISYTFLATRFRRVIIWLTFHTSMQAFSVAKEAFEYCDTVTCFEASYSHWAEKCSQTPYYRIY